MPRPDRTKEKTPAAPTAEVLDAKTPNVEIERTKPVNSIPVASKSEPVNLSGQLIPVLFGPDTLILVEHNGQPYVVMKPLVIAMGLAWQPQYAKLLEKFGATIMEIVTVADDGKPRSMICLPLRKLPGWLYSINPGKLAPALRPTVVRYQEESDEVLWRHWSGTYLPQHSLQHVSLSRLNLSYEREHTRVCLELSRCTELGLGTALFDKYRRLCGLLGAMVVECETLAPALRQKRLALEGSTP